MEHININLYEQIQNNQDHYSFEHIWYSPQLKFYRLDKNINLVQLYLRGKKYNNFHKVININFREHKDYCYFRKSSLNNYTFLMLSLIYKKYIQFHRGQSMFYNLNGIPSKLLL